jgi:hypothetical protein
MLDEVIFFASNSLKCLGLCINLCISLFSSSCRLNKVSDVVVSDAGLVYLSGGDDRHSPVSVFDLAGNFYGVLGRPGAITYAGGSML